MRRGGEFVSSEDEGRNGRSEASSTTSRELLDVDRTHDKNVSLLRGKLHDLGHLKMGRNRRPGELLRREDAKGARKKGAKSELTIWLPAIWG